MQQQQPIQPPTQYYEQQQPQQQQQQQQSFQQYEQMPEPTDQAAQSYFPSPARQEESQIEQAVDGTHSGVEEFEHTQEPQVAEAVNEVAEEEHYAENSYEQEYENEVTAQAEPEVEEDEEEAPRSPSPAPTQTPSKAPVSAWGQIPSLATPVSSNPPSRKSSIAGPTPAAAAKAPAAQASVPAKQAVSVAAESTPVATPEKATTTPRPAPWAQGDKDGRTASAGPSLREIQEAEAKRAEQRKAALARAAAPSPSLVPASEKEESIPTSMSWGLPSSGTRNTAVSSPSISSPAAPVWGGGDAAAPKKTMKQIQEEEEKRRLKAAAAAKAAAGPAASAVGQSKRGYADLAAVSAGGSVFDRIQLIVYIDLAATSGSRLDHRRSQALPCGDGDCHSTSSLDASCQTPLFYHHGFSTLHRLVAVGRKSRQQVERLRGVGTFCRVHQVDQGCSHRSQRER